MEQKTYSDRHDHKDNLDRRSFLTQAGVTAAAITAGAVLPVSSAVSATNDDALPDNDIIYSSATKLARKIRSKKLSSVEVVEAHIERIKKVNPAINAVIVLVEEQALNRAKEADDALARGENWGPLHGVPVTIKDEWETEGIVTTAGAKMWEHHIPEKDATAVARLKEAGAIVLGKTNIPEFAGAIETYNLIHGRCNNPYDLERAVGGSSGGEAAIIACGGSPLGFGNDGGGSIRIPSHFCGIAGLKPTSGRIPQSGSLLFGPGPGTHWATGGPMARHVEDLWLGLKIMSGPDVEDIYSVPVPLKSYRKVDASNLRIAYYVSDPFRPAVPEVQDVVKDAVSVLNDHCASIEERMPPGVGEDSFWPMMLRLLSSPLDSDKKKKETFPTWDEPRIFWERMREEYDLDLPSGQAKAQEEWFEFEQGMRRFLMEEFDAIVCPAWPCPAYPHGESWKKDENGDVMSDVVYTAYYNAARVPAAVVRGGTSSEGLPLGVQVVAGHWREDIVLAIAEILERELGPWQAPPI